MNIRHVFILLLDLSGIHAAIEGWNNEFYGEFSVAGNGRLGFHTVLMYIQNIDLEECMNICMQHLQCVSISFSESTNECELNDMQFDDQEKDYDAVGWKNYYRTPMVHGGFSEWKIKSASPSIVVYYRSCNNPSPKHGGDQCEGAYEKTRRCSELNSCNIALGKPSKQSGAWDNLAKNEALSANDGNISTCSATLTGDILWWELDLQEIVAVKMIKLVLLKYAFDKDLYNELKVLTKVRSSDNWNVLKSIGTPTSLQVDIPCNVDAHYVRVQINGSIKIDLLYLSEVEVYKQLPFHL